jgi:hypothetical protein
MSQGLKFCGSEADEDFYPPQGGTEMSALWVWLYPVGRFYRAIKLTS